MINHFPIKLKSKNAEHKTIRSYHTSKSLKSAVIMSLDEKQYLHDQTIMIE